MQPFIEVDRNTLGSVENNRMSRRCYQPVPNFHHRLLVRESVHDPLDAFVDKPLHVEVNSFVLSRPRIMQDAGQSQ